MSTPETRQPRERRFFERRSDGPVRRLHAVGDVGFCGRLGAPHDADPWPEIAPLLRSGDAAFANLESPLVAAGAPVGSYFVGRVGSVRALAAGGFGVVSVANNHVGDAGADGIALTLGALGAAGVVSVGAGADAASARQLVVTALGDLRCGWLACARTLQPQNDSRPAFWELDAEELLAAVRRHRGEVDVLVVSIHWGYMFVDYPDPVHRRLTHQLAAAGADLVLCHHAHVLQGIEVVPGWQGRTAGVCHNLGNFAFDWRLGRIVVEGWGEEQRTGAVVVADFDRDGLCRLAALPTRIEEVGAEEDGDGLVVRWATGESGQAVLERLARISADLAGDYEPEFRRQRAERNTSLALRSVLGSLRRGEVAEVLSLLARLRPRHLAMLVRWLLAGLR